MPALAPEKTDQPRELPPGEWEPPPVRRGSASQEQAAQPVEETAAEHPPEEPGDDGQPLVSKRRAWLAIAVVLPLTVIILGGVGLKVWSMVRYNEGTVADRAHDYYQQGSFSNAENEFRLLEQKSPTSEHIEKYHFMAEWCGVCNSVSNPDADVVAVAAQFNQFVKTHKNDPLMGELEHDAGQRLLRLVESLVARSADPKDEQPLQAVERIEQLRRTVTALRADALSQKESNQIDADLSKVRKAVERAIKRRKVLAALTIQGKETPIDAIKRAQSLLVQKERELPGIRQDPEARTALTKLEEAHLASVVYHEAAEAPPPPPALPVDEGEPMRFAPLASPAWLGNNAPPDDRIVLALVRGMLYALKKTTGDLKWATRVGIDTTVLPLHVPLSAFNSELLLVLSADTQTLSALNADGESQWTYHVGQPVLGRPIIIDRRAFLPDYSGWVHEIELSRGQLLGRWFLGQRLTCGGTREGETNRIYFPADDFCIYVLDVSPSSRRCATILYDGHLSGSLRSEPVVIPPEGDGASGYLILNQASGLDEMRLRVFELPLQDPHADPLSLNPPALLPGWTWFEPKTDGEKVAVLSDAGVLGLFGIHQLGNMDPALFPWLQPGGLDLSSFLDPSAATAKERALPRERGRAQVVHMQGDSLWVLAHGRFQQVNLEMKWKTGPQAVPGWTTPLMLGSPLHEPQRIEDRNGNSPFYLVTQALEQQVCLATAVDELGQMLWQRQLGLVCQGEPLMLTPPGGGPPLLLALDQGGGLFELDPQLPPDKLRCVRKVLAPALAENPHLPPRLLRAADGHSAYEVAASGDGKQMIVRRIEWAGDQRELRFNECSVSLLDPNDQSGTRVLTPACPPVVAGSQLLIAMTDGHVRGLSLTDDKPQLESGPSWRDLRIPVLAPCHLLALDGDRFLTTNGNLSLSVHEWPAGKDYRLLPKEGEPLKPLEHLVAAPPVLLPSADGQPPRVVVADSSGVLRLFAVAPDGSLQPGLTWPLNGNLSSGPFVQAAPEGGWRIGCVLDRSNLLWIDPSKAKPLWTYPSDGPAIIGQPQRIEDMLVAALQSGHYVGIDPSTGKPKGRGYTLRASVAPAATPVSFGPGRMFAPLSDGTALLLSVELLKKN